VVTPSAEVLEAKLLGDQVLLIICSRFATATIMCNDFITCYYPQGVLKLSTTR